MAVVTIKQVKLHSQDKAVLVEMVVYSRQEVLQLITLAAVAVVLFKVVVVTVDQVAKAEEAEVAEETLVLQQFKADLQTQAVAQVVADKLDQVQTVVQV